VTLAEALAEAAAALPGAEVIDTDGATEWAVDGRPFAALSGQTAEFRLTPPIARAALATADTGPSARGADWVAFSPPELDRFALDRATAWLASAHRHAAGRRN
jgi:hypothetical protein